MVHRGEVFVMVRYIRAAAFGCLFTLGRNANFPVEDCDYQGGRRDSVSPWPSANRCITATVVVAIYYF